MAEKETITDIKDFSLFQDKFDTARNKLRTAAYEDGTPVYSEAFVDWLDNLTNDSFYLESQRGAPGGGKFRGSDKLETFIAFLKHKAKQEGIDVNEQRPNHPFTGSGDIDADINAEFYKTHTRDGLPKETTPTETTDTTDTTETPSPTEEELDAKFNNLKSQYLNKQFGLKEEEIPTFEEWERKDISEEALKKKKKAEVAGDIISAIGSFSDDLINAVAAFKGYSGDNSSSMSDLSQKIANRRKSVRDEYQKEVDNIRDVNRYIRSQNAQFEHEKQKALFEDALADKNMRKAAQYQLLNSPNFGGPLK